MPLGKPLQPQRRIEPGPFRAQRCDRVALLADFGIQPQHALDPRGRFYLDAVDVGRREDQHADDEEMEDAHRQPPRITSASRGQDGRASAECTGAWVRSAARSFADRARGLAAVSASPGTTGRLVRIWKLGAACATSGRCRDPPDALPRAARKFLTMRSSSEWNETTTSRPPGLSTRSAAESPASNSPSSSFTNSRKAW